MSVKKLSQAGFNLVELMIAVGILAGLSSAVMMARSYMAKQTVSTNDKAYATQKAIQMFEELKALVNGSENSVNVLDNYSDGTNYNPILTTDTTVNNGVTANAGNALSGNKPTQGGAWRYLRQIQVNHVANDAYTRQIIIKVWLYQSDANPTLPGTLLSEIGGNLRTIASTFPPTQVMDVYVLAINNIAGWWAHEPVLYQTFQSIINDIQGRNPGFAIRPHYITRTSYGRDSQYLPYINIYPYNTDGNNDATGSLVTTSTTIGNMPFVYMYPGYTYEDAADGSVSDCFYDPGQSQDIPLGVCLDGNFDVGGSYDDTSLQFTNCPNYTVADMYNNSMRYPDELAMYQAVTSAASSAVPAVPAQDSVTEISWRMLMEGMLDEPQSFTNALIVNLHGELCPLPPMRNYSDPAKDPGSLDNANDTNIRVVTHPQMLYYPGNSTTSANVGVTLNVYAYYDGMDAAVSLDSLYSPVNDPKTNISLFFPDLNTGASILGVTAIIGNSSQASTVAPATGPVTYQYDAFTIPTGGSGSTPGIYNGSLADGTNITGQGPVSVGVSYVGANKQMLITLYNTRLRCPSGPSTSVAANGATIGGLNIFDRLYGLEYIPCSPDMSSLTSPVTFTKQDLTDPAANGTPKNTARWLVSLSVPVTSGFPFVTAATPLTIQNASGIPQIYDKPVTFIGQHTIETRIGAAVTSNGAPSNLSRTYLWTGWSAVADEGSSYVTTGTFPPTTEQYQFLGDPRHEPYLDVKVGGINNGQAVVIQKNGYNWYFKDGARPTTGVPVANSVGMNNDGYVSFGIAGDTSGSLQNGPGTRYGGWWGADGNFVDLPRFHSMVMNGLLNATGVWTTMNGWTYYYYGMGGEFGSDQPPFQNGITINASLYSTTANAAVDYVSEIIPYTDGGAASITSLHLPANTQQTWYAKTWLGELYPDSMYTAWSFYGNLPSANIGGPSKFTFYREDFGSIPTTLYSGTVTVSYGNGNSLTGFGRQVTNRAGANGCSSFYNGSANGSGTDNTFNHEGTGDTDSTTSMAASCFNIFQYPLPVEVVNSSGRPWALNQGNYPPQWNIAPYSTHNTLTVPEVNGTSRVFYTTSAGSPWTGTGVVQITNPNGLANGEPVTQVAYVVESGLSISAQVGTSDLGETALVALLRTFLDGGNYASPGHITQVPLIECYVDSPTNQYYQPSVINVIVDGAVTTGTATSVTLVGGAVTTLSTGPTNNIWYRYPGLTSSTANFYTEEYPGYPTLASSTYVETGGSGTTPINLDMNFKYSTDSGNTWLFMNNNGPATFGVLDSSADGNLYTSNSFPYSFAWNVNSFPQGNYEIMVEAYRQNMPLDYAYHILTVTIDQ